MHCEWDEWVIGECSLTCGGGTRTNTRSEKVEAKHEGEACTGPASITESCNVELCPGNNLISILVLAKKLSSFTITNGKPKVFLTSIFQVVGVEILAVQPQINAM